jgi:hypothetical protein
MVMSAMTCPYAVTRTSPVAVTRRTAVAVTRTDAGVGGTTVPACFLNPALTPIGMPTRIGGPKKVPI